MIVGVTLVVVGIVLLLDSLGVLDGVDIGQLWPVVPIALGIAIIYDRVRRSWRRQ